MINTKIISDLNPCSDRFENWKKYYDVKSSIKSYTYAQFLGLKNITQADKVWVCFRLMAKDKVRFCAADIAELVLPMFESKYPNDNRPRLAIEAARAIPLDMEKVKDAADAATAYANAANAAAYAANAAAYAADAATYAANATAYANAAAYAAYAANAADRKTIEKQIRTIVLKYLNQGNKQYV